VLIPKWINRVSLSCAALAQAALTRSALDGASQSHTELIRAALINAALHHAAYSTLVRPKINDIQFFNTPHLLFGHTLFFLDEIYLTKYGGFKQSQKIGLGNLIFWLKKIDFPISRRLFDHVDSKVTTFDQKWLFYRFYGSKNSNFLYF